VYRLGQVRLVKESGGSWWWKSVQKMPDTKTCAKFKFTCNGGKMDKDEEKWIKMY
jgi:hypothetical protein